MLKGILFQLITKFIKSKNLALTFPFNDFNSKLQKYNIILSQ